MSSEPSKTIPPPKPSKRYVLFDGMTWPLYDGDTEWRLRHAPQGITQQDQLYLASVLAAYDALLNHRTQKGRTRICTSIQDAASRLRRVSA